LYVHLHSQYVDNRLYQHITQKKQNHNLMCVVECVRPGHRGTLPDSQQDRLCVDEKSPAGETGQQEDENPSLQYHTHPLQIFTPKRLQDTIPFK